MKLTFLSLALLGLCSSSFGRVVPQVKCNPAECALPDCFCSGTVPPINPKNPEKNPQIVYLTFDDDVNEVMYPLYQEIFNGRKNPNGAAIQGTFYVTHEYNNYSMTHELWTQGHEIALHSITHKTDQDYWKNLDDKGWVAEVIEQREQIAHFAKIDKKDIVGFRAPFLQGGGDNLYKALYEGGLEYESSRPTLLFRPNLFPYTNDFETIQDCEILPCPVKSYPGFWTSPLDDLMGGDGEVCAFADQCLPLPITKEETYDLLWNNFLEFYEGARAPYGLYIHAAWLLNSDAPDRKDGYLQFIDKVLTLGDVYIVSTKNGLEWMRNPVGLDKVKEFAPWLDKANFHPNTCLRPFTCVYDQDHVPPGFWGERIMTSCAGVCPPQYPWLGNHLGEEL